MCRTSALSWLSLILAFLSALAVAVTQERTADISIWPLSAAKAQILAGVSYNSTHATLKQYKPPHLAQGEELVRIGFEHPSSGAWSGIATSAQNFVPSKHKKILLHLDSRGALYHVGFIASDIATSDSGQRSSDPEENVSVEVIKTLPGPVPQLNKPVVVNKEGKVDDPEAEKTFIQKYWWVVAAFIVAQLVMGGAKE